jgi:perosamine synthetase
MYSDIVKFIHELYRTDEQVYLHNPYLIGNEKKYLNECIDSTFVSSVGRFVTLFEEKIANYTGAKKAVVCVNGTSALHMAMMLVGVERNDEVITQALTFIATCNAISYIGAHPVFIDVDRDTMGLSPVAVEKWLSHNAEMRAGVCFNKTTGRRIKACVPMHTFGHPVHLDELVAVCKNYNVELVEDAAESLGSFYKGKHTGTFGRVGAISFNGNKTITTGGGGALLFNDEKLAKQAKHLTTQAKVSHKWEFIHDAIGYNYRMPNVNAAIGCAQIEKIEHILSNKRETSTSYLNFFEGQENIEFFKEPKDCQSNYWLNVILLKDKNAQQEFLQFSNDHGVMTRPIWQLMNKLPMFSDCQTDELENTKWFEDRVVNIPSSVNKKSKN